MSRTVKRKNSNKQFHSNGEQTVAAQNDVTAEKLLAYCCKTFSGRPEDWTVSSLCHLYLPHL